MIKNLLLVSALSLSGSAFGQVGINNTAPNATLDVTAKTTNGTKPEGFIAPRLTGDQMAAGDAQYTNLQTGTLVYATARVSGIPVGKTLNVTVPGYYYYDGAASIPRWMRVANPSLAADTTDDAWINSGTSVILQNTNGTARTAGTEFVALNNGNVGIGTASPQRSLEVVGNIVIGNPTEYVPSYNALQLNNDGGDPKNTFRIDPFANQFDIVADSQTGATVGASIALRTSAAGAADAAVRLLVNPVGNVGIGTTTPNKLLEIKSAATNTSGLRLTNLTSSSPVSGGATLGVNAQGDVVTVTGNAFTPVSARILSSGLINISANSSATLATFTLPSAGTYLVNFSARGQYQTSGGTAISSANLVAYLTNDTDALLTDSEVLIVVWSKSTSAGSTENGGTGTGTAILTVAGPTTYKLWAKSSGAPAVIFSDSNGKTSVTYVKVAP